MSSAIRPFVYEALPYRVIFGQDTLASLREEAARLGIRRALVLTTPQQVEQGHVAGRHLGDLLAGQFSEAQMHTPVAVTERALAQVIGQDIDGLVAIGGGSTIGLGKALSLRSGLPQIAVPTTYAGSEMTPILGETSEGIKTTKRQPEILPDTIIYDVRLTLGLPVPMSATSGMNAIAHAVEALYAPDTNPIISMMAESGAAALVRALPVIRDDARNLAARTDALYGAWLCGACLGVVTMSLHHKLCHVLGGSFDLPHSETHSAVLPHAIAYNAPAAPEAMARMARAMGTEDVAEGLYDLAKSLGIRMDLAGLGMPETGIDRAADIAVQNPYANPRPIEREAIRALIARAYRGDRPQS